MEKKKNAEPITLFSNDTGDILDEGADYFTEDALMYGLAGSEFPGDIEDVQRDVIQKLDLEGRAIPDTEGNLMLVEELSPEDFFKKLPSLVSDSYAGMDTVHKAVYDAIYDALYESGFYLNDELERRHEDFANFLYESGLLKDEEPYLMLKGVNPSHIGHKLPSIKDTEDIVNALEGDVASSHRAGSVRPSRIKSLPLKSRSRWTTTTISVMLSTKPCPNSTKGKKRRVLCATTR